MLSHGQVYVTPRPHNDIATDLLNDLNDPASAYSQLVASGDHQAVAAYTYVKASLINVPPDYVGITHTDIRSHLKLAPFATP